MGNCPLVTVIIPLYNGEQYIRRSVESVLAQTYDQFELIVIDDGSTDSGKDIVLTISDPRLRIVHQINMGVSAARNKGISEGRGKYYAFLDADDEWDIGFLEALVNLSYIYPLAGIYGSGYRFLFLDGNVIEITAAESKKKIKTVLITDYFYRSNFMGLINASGVMIPRHIFEQIGLFKIGEHYEEDDEMWVRIAFNYHIAYDTRILSSYYQTGTTNKPRFNNYQKYSLTVKTIQKQLFENSECLHNYKELIRRINTICVSKAFHLISINKRSEALEYLINNNIINTSPLFYKLIANKMCWPFIFLISFVRRFINSRHTMYIFGREKVSCGVIKRLLKV